MSPHDFGPDQLKRTIFDILDDTEYVEHIVYLYYTQFTNENNDYLIKIYKSDKDPEDISTYFYAKYNLTYDFDYRLNNLLDTQHLNNFLDNIFMRSSNIRIEQHTPDEGLINIVYPFDDKRKNEELGGSSSKKPRSGFGKKSKNCLNLDIIYLKNLK